MIRWGHVRSNPVGEVSGLINRMATLKMIRRKRNFSKQSATGANATESQTLVCDGQVADPGFNLNLPTLSVHLWLPV